MPRARVCNSSPGGGRHYYYGEWPPCDDGYHRHVLSGWADWKCLGDWANYTASPLRAFENELAGTKFTVNCTRKAWTEAVAPGMVSSYHGGVSIKAMNSCVQATVPLEF